MGCARPFAFFRGSARGSRVLVSAARRTLEGGESSRWRGGAIASTRRVGSQILPWPTDLRRSRSAASGPFFAIFSSHRAFLLGECGVAALLKD